MFASPQPDTLRIGWWYSVSPSDSVVVWTQKSADAGDIFGHLSSRGVQVLPKEPFWGGLDAISWQGSVIVVVMLALYCYILFRYRNEIRVSFKAAFSLEDTLFIFENLTLNFARFFRFSMLLLYMCVATLICRFVDVWEQLTYVAIVIAALFVAGLVSIIVRQISSKFDYQAARWHDISSITRLNCAVCAIVLTPAVLVLVPTARYAFVALIVCAALVLYHWLSLFRYFRAAGFSILQWILYLCAVEAVPFSLLAGVAKWNGLLN